MRRGRASRTAEMVALWRAMGEAGHTSVPGFTDPFAAALLSPAWHRRFLGIQARLVAAQAAGKPVDSARWDWVLLRVVTLDRQIREAVAAGARQLVILGAGFDTRAWRLAELAGVRVFEVDHPDTQAEKRARVAALPAPASPPVFVPVDFTRERLADALAQAGHRADLPTVWIWEGVVMYLTDAAVADTLTQVRARSGPGSALAIHYHVPAAAWHTRLWRWAFFNLLGEAQVGDRTPEAMARLVQDAGFRVLEDLSIQDQARLAGGPDRGLERGAASRILRCGPGDVS